MNHSVESDLSQLVRDPAVAFDTTKAMDQNLDGDVQPEKDQNFVISAYEEGPFSVEPFV